jgi:hypothetical protein
MSSANDSFGFSSNSVVVGIFPRRRLRQLVGDLFELLNQHDYSATQLRLMLAEASKLYEDSEVVIEIRRVIDLHEELALSGIIMLRSLASDAAVQLLRRLSHEQQNPWIRLEALRALGRLNYQVDIGEVIVLTEQCERCERPIAHIPRSPQLDLP